MKTNWRLPALSLVGALALAACGTRQDRAAAIPDDLKQDLAVASASSSDLAGAPRSYQRMRFVSGVEQIPSAAPAKRAVAAHRATRAVAPHRSTRARTTDAVPDPVATMAAEAPAPVTRTESAEPEAPTVVVESPTPAPASEPAPASGGSPEGSGRAGRGGGMGGLGGILGGIIGAVVIRGGAGGIDHCDPRHDGRARPDVGGRPDFGMPMPTGRVFGGMGRH